MKKMIICIFVLVLAQKCFAQTTLHLNVSATVVSVDGILKEAKIGPLASKKDSLHVFDSIMLEKAKNIKIEPFGVKEGMTMEEVEKGKGKPLNIIPFQCCEGKEKWVYADMILYFKDYKVDIIFFQKRN